MKKRTDQLQLIFSMVIFGTIGLARKMIPYPSSVVALARAVIGSAFLLIQRLIRRPGEPMEGLRRNLPLLILSGVLIGANWIALFEAYRYTSVSVATMCYYMAPVFVMLLSPLLLHEQLSRRKALCAAVAVAGMVLVSGVLETGVSGMTGVLLGLLAAAMYATIIFLNKFISGMTADDRTLVQLGVSAISLLPYVLLTENLTTLEITLPAVAMLLLVGIVHTGLTYAMYFGSLKTIPAQTAALLSYIDPVVAVLLSVTVLREPASPLSLLGAVLVIGSMVVSEGKG